MRRLLYLLLRAFQLLRHYTTVLVVALVIAYPIYRRLYHPAAMWGAILLVGLLLELAWRRFTRWRAEKKERPDAGLWE